MADHRRTQKRDHNPKGLHGIWSHGVANGYYGGSHDLRLVFLPYGRGSFCHDGWWRYRLITFYWHVTPNYSMQFLAQKSVAETNPGLLKLTVSLEPISLTWDDQQQMPRLRVPIQDEPNDYYRISSNLKLAREYLEPDDWGGCCFPFLGTWDSEGEEAT